MQINFSIPKRGSNQLKETEELWNQNDKEVGDRSRGFDANLNSSTDYKSLFNLSPDNYSSNVFSIGKHEKKHDEFIPNNWLNKELKNKHDFPLDNELEQQSSKYYENQEKIDEIDLTLSNVNLKKIKDSPFKEISGKSPIINQEEADELFKSRNRTKNKDNNDSSDEFSNDEKLINPFGNISFYLVFL